MRHRRALKKTWCAGGRRSRAGKSKRQRAAAKNEARGTSTGGFNNGWKGRSARSHPQNKRHPFRASVLSDPLVVRRHGREDHARHHNVFGSFGFGWFGIIFLRLNLPEFVDAKVLIFKTLRPPLRAACLAVSGRGQGQCPVLNLEEGEDHFADGFRWLSRTIFDGDAQHLWVCACKQCKCRVKPKVRSRIVVERVACDGY